MDRNSYVDQSAARRTLLGDLFRRYREEVAPRHKGGDVEAYCLRAWERENIHCQVPDDSI